MKDNNINCIFLDNGEKLEEIIDNYLNYFLLEKINNEGE